MTEDLRDIWVNLAAAHPLLKLSLHMGLRGKGWRKADLSRAMSVDQKSVDRLLDLNHSSRLEQLESAFELSAARVSGGPRR